MFVIVSPDAEKNGQATEMEIKAETAEILDAYLKEHRKNLRGEQSPYLIAGEKHPMRDSFGLREAISQGVLNLTGLHVSPHLFRHIAARIVLERHPELIGAVGRHLGHRSITTPYGHYLGTETPAASRTLGAILDQAIEESK